MSPLEQFFIFSFISVFSVALLSTWLRYLPTLISLYRTTLRNNRHHSEKYLGNNWNFSK